MRTNVRENSIPFGSDEFGEDGYLSRRLGRNDKISIVVADRNGDGLIELEDTCFQLTSRTPLSREYGSEIVDAAGDNLKVHS